MRRRCVDFPGFNGHEFSSMDVPNSSKFVPELADGVEVRPRLSDEEKRRQSPHPTQPRKQFCWTKPIAKPCGKLSGSCRALS